MLGQESLPAREFHRCIISSLCLVKLLKLWSQFTYVWFSIRPGHHPKYMMWLSNFLAGIWLLPATLLTGFLFRRATVELALGLPRGLISNVVDPKQQKWFHVERLLTAPGLTRAPKEYKTAPESPISYTPILHCCLRKVSWISTLHVIYIIVLTAL